MARFTFSLQTVREQREREERLCQKALGEASVRRQQHEDELAEVERQITSNNELMRDNHLIGKLNVAMLTTHRRYLIAMRQQVISLAQRIAAARLEVEQARRKLNDAAKNTKAIETLRDRQKQRWQAELERKELAQADDVAMQIAFHNLALSAAAGGEHR